MPASPHVGWHQVVETEEMEVPEGDQVPKGTIPVVYAGKLQLIKYIS